MNQDLIERYLYAVTKRMPRKQREDVSQELRGLIDDMLAERCGGLTPTEKDVRVVLTELGTPQELSEKYDENETRCLIGQPYYGTYVFVMKIVMICTAVGLTLSSAILQIMEPQVWYAAVGQWLSMLWQGLLTAFAIVTALFAFFYQKGIRIREPFSFDDLPPVPKKNQEIPKWECIVGIGISVVFTTVFLAAPQIFCVILRGSRWIPIFDAAVIHSTWYIILLFAACGISRELVKLMEGRYNKTVMLAVAAADVISAVLSFWWLAGFPLVNPEFTVEISALFGEEEVFITGIFSHFQYFFLGILLFALTLDTVDTLVKTLRD